MLCCVYVSLKFIEKENAVLREGWQTHHTLNQVLSNIHYNLCFKTYTIFQRYLKFILESFKAFFFNKRSKEKVSPFFHSKSYPFKITSKA